MPTMISPPSFTSGDGGTLKNNLTCKSPSFIFFAHLDSHLFLPTAPSRSCFHFAYQFPFETFYEAIRRHEHQLAANLGVYGNDKHVLDVGCGIGGPMRNIAKFLQCNVTGITLNPYQVNRGNELTQADKFVADKCKSVQGDFMEQPFKDQEFDAAYAIEATCHAPDRVKCYKEVYRLLKPGAHFALYEWCMTEK